jgi:diguanylate cyclase (GGDEF)-like protein/PAS domain S-box-containing protein
MNVNRWTDRLRPDMSVKMKYLAVICISVSILIIGFFILLYLLKGNIYVLLLSTLLTAVISGITIVLINKTVLKIKQLENKYIELEKSYQDLEFKRKRLDLVMDGSSEGFWDWNIASGETFYSNHWYKMLGYDPCETKVDFNVIAQTIHPDDLPDVMKTIQNNSTGDLEYYDREDRFLTKNGQLKWFLIHGKIVEYSPDGKPVRMAGIVKDISEKKKHEEEILYLGFHDKLTGLYNRAYFEMELKNCLATDQPLSILMGDVNGLKIANDVFGHEEGDRLLKVVAEILTNACRENDIVARYGGDEFAIILKDSNEEILSNVLKNIENACNKYEKSIIKPSISVGTVTRSAKLHNAAQLLKSVEEKMYRNKFLVDRSTHSSIFNSLRQALAEKDFGSEEHSQRLSESCVKIGQSIGLKNDELDQLALLGILHDIGKVAISDEILLKPGRLDEREWEIMKQHSEIGYRIAKASIDLSHIADAILSHHERYDGNGYPQGLKGDEIPVIARIIAIVDSFDAMTHKRAYRETMSEESAVNELKRCSGTQFDPQILEVFLSSTLADT